MSAAPLLEARSVVKRYGGVVALDGVSAAFAAGRITAVIGPNGAGKTTFFQVCSGVVEATSGEVIFDGRRLGGLPPHSRAARGLARTFQTPRAFLNLTVLENVLAGQHIRSYAGFWHATLRTGRYRRAERAALDRARAALAFVSDDLHRRRHDLAKTLPYGLLKQLELARGLAAEPRALLLDEPAAGLNSGEKAHLGGLIRRIAGQGTTPLVVEHDMRLVQSVSDWIVVFDRGRVLAEGTPAQVRADERVIKAYLGEALQ